MRVTEWKGRGSAGSIRRGRPPLQGAEGYHRLDWRHFGLGGARKRPSRTPGWPDWQGPRRAWQKLRPQLWRIALSVRNAASATRGFRVAAVNLPKPRRILRLSGRIPGIQRSRRGPGFAAPGAILSNSMTCFLPVLGLLQGVNPGQRLDELLDHPQKVVASNHFSAFSEILVTGSVTAAVRTLSTASLISPCPGFESGRLWKSSLPVP